VTAVLERNPEASLSDIEGAEELRPVFDNIESSCFREVIASVLDVVELRNRVVQQVYESTGITECHPSRDTGDWYPYQDGTLGASPSNEILRASLAKKLETPQQSLINLVNKVSTHTCSASGYCRRRGAGEGETRCRFGFPKPRVGHHISQDDDANGEVRIVPDVHPIPGRIARFKLSDGRIGHNRLAFERNHRFTPNLQHQLLLVWGGIH